MADQMKPTPRSPILGLFSDIVNLPLQYMSEPQRTQQMQGVAQFLYDTGIPKTLERASYGEPLFSGAGMTLRPKEETINAAMNVAPFVKPAAVMANRSAMTAGRAGEKLAERVVPQVMSRGGLPAQLLGDISRSSVSPAVQLGSDFLGKKPPTPEQLARVSDKFLYHSSTADKANDLLYGIEPQAGGNWVREIAGGAVEGNLDDFFENVTPLSWFSDNPSWIKAMVGRKLDKPFDKVTVDDIEKHGHLAIINKKSPSAKDIYFLPEQGLNEGSQSIVYDIQGNPKKAWQTDLYQEGNYGQRMEPFGTERNEYVSAKTVEPFIQLTGKDLVDFMKAQGLIEDNKIVESGVRATEGLPVGMSIKDVGVKYPQQAALDLAQQRAALPVSEGGLGLPPNNTAMDRAKAMGFDVDAYHGTASKDIQKFMPEGGTPEGEKTLEWYKNRQAQNEPVGYMAFRGGSFFSPKPEYAGSYAPEGTGVVYPVKLRMNNPLSLLPNAQGRYSATNAPDINKTIDAMILQDSIDRSINEIAIIDPDQLRSRFAAFDPFRKDVATATAMGVALPDLLAQPVNQYRPTYEPIPTYTDPFGNTIDFSIR